MIVLSHIFYEHLRSLKGKITKKSLQDYCPQFHLKPLNKYFNKILLPVILHKNSKIGESNGLHYFGVLIDLKNRQITIYDSYGFDHSKDFAYIHNIMMRFCPTIYKKFAQNAQDFLEIAQKKI